MNANQYRKLKLGQAIRLTSAQKVYGIGWPTDDGRAYIAAGSVGTVGAIRVPSVRRESVTFACIDFPASQPLSDWKGKPIAGNAKVTAYRVGALADEMETV